jgi:hypothetical protein
MSQTDVQLPDPVSTSENMNNLCRLPKIQSLFLTRISHNLITIKTELSWNVFFLIMTSFVKRFGKQVSKNYIQPTIVNYCVRAPSTLVSMRCCWVITLVAVSIIQPKIALEIILLTNLAREEYNDRRHARLRIFVYKHVPCSEKKVPHLFGISQHAITTKNPLL